jgi:hypothetical protein
MLTEILGAAATGAIISAFATMRVAARNIHVDSVTKERTKWREHIRELADKLTMATRNGQLQEVQRLRLQFQLRLNPQDEADRSILSNIDRIVTAPATQRLVALDDVTARVALLLKHDWERAKYETRFLITRGKAPQRVAYAPATVVGKEVSAGRNMPFLTAVGWLATMIAAAGVIFFLAAGLSKPFSELLMSFNDPATTHPAREWLGLAVAALIFGLMWSILHLVFKIAEKKLVDEGGRSVVKRQVNV